MADAIKNVKAAAGSTKRRIRRGRGIASGSGKTCDRGHRGQKCRSGYSSSPRREGGQTPLYRRLPKHQVNERVNRKEYTVINLIDIQDLADAGIKEINIESLREVGRIKQTEAWGLKVLATGEINAAVTVTAASFSNAAREAIEKAGGKALVA